MIVVRTNAPISLHIELEIEREGDEIRIRPARRSLSGTLTKFANFSAGFMVNERGEQNQADRAPQ